MDLPIYNTNHDDPPGPLVTMDPTSYIPTAADSMVPLPPGLQISTLESSIDTTHPITLSYRLAEADFHNLTLELSTTMPLPTFQSSSHTASTPLRTTPLNTKHGSLLQPKDP